MSVIQEIMNADNPSLPDHCLLGNRAFITDGLHVNKVVMNADGDWRPMGAREQAAELNLQYAENASGPIAYGQRVTYGLRRVLTANGLEVTGGISVAYLQVPAYSGGTTPEPTVAVTLTVMPYEFSLPDGCSVSYQIYRSKSENTELLYLAAELTSAQVSALASHRYTDIIAESALLDSSIDLASDGMELTIPPVRYIRAWKGSLVCGGFMRTSVKVTGTASEEEITTEPELPVDDIGCFLYIEGEPYTYQILDIDGDGNATLDNELAYGHDGSQAERWRDDDVVYISRQLPDNIEVYSAENGRLIANSGSDNAISGIASHGSYAYIFRRDTVDILTGTPSSPELEPFPGNPPGCRSAATIADGLSPVVFYYAGDSGVWCISGTEAKRISGDVDSVLTDEVDHSQDEFCHAVYDSSSCLYWLFLFSKDWQDSGVRVPDMFLLYDYSTGAWSRGEMFASRSGLFRDDAGRMVPVIGVPCGVARLGVGDSDGGEFVEGEVTAAGDGWFQVDAGCGDVSMIVPGMPVFFSEKYESDPMQSPKRMVQSSSGDVISIYGELPAMVKTGCHVRIGAIRWSFRTPEIGVSGDFDRQMRVDSLAIAHERAQVGMPVTVTASARGGMSGRTADSQKWEGVFSFETRSLSRIDGKATGLRGSSIDAVVSGALAPAAVKAVRIEMTRVAR